MALMSRQPLSISAGAFHVTGGCHFLNSFRAGILAKHEHGVVEAIHLYLIHYPESLEDSSALQYADCHPTTFSTFLMLPVVEFLGVWDMLRVEGSHLCTYLYTLYTIQYFSPVVIYVAGCEFAEILINLFGCSLNKEYED
jgi:hypothetical protein